MSTAETTLRADEAHSRTPAANALKHGLTARRFVPPEQQQRMRDILAELRLIHEPQSAEERECVDELAAALARLYDVEAAAWERLEWEKDNAADRFDRRMREQFETDLAEWRDEPLIWQEVFARTALGAAHIAAVWADIAEALGDGVSTCSFELVKDAMVAEGSPWQVARVRQSGSWIICRYLALTGDPEAELQRWVKDGRDETSGPIADDLRRARWHLDRTPEPAAARHELLEKAIAERDRWALQANELRSNYETDRDTAADRAVGMVPGDAEASRESRLALRYLTAARNRADRLERRLDSLKRLRPIHTMRRHSHFEARTPVVSPPVPPLPAWMIDDLEAMDAENDDLERQNRELEAQIAAEEAAEALEEARFAQKQADHHVAIAPNPAPERPHRRPDPAAVARMYRNKSKGR